MLTFVAFVAALSLSDRAPKITRSGLRAGRDLFHNIELRAGFDLLDRSDVPLAWDTVGHLVLWSVAGFIGWVTVGRRVGPLFLIAALTAVSAGVEIAQVYLSSTRMAELSDLMANATGITIGVLVAVVLDLAARGLQRVRSLAG